MKEELKRLLEENLEANKTYIDERLKNVEKTIEAVKKVPGSDEDPTGGFKKGEFFKSVFNASPKAGNGQIDPRLKEMTKAFGDATIAEDGWPLPVAMRNEFIQMVIESSNILSMCKPVPVAVNSIDLPVLDSTTITTYWITEGARLTDSEPAADKINLKLCKLTSLAIVNSELLQDSPISLDSVLAYQFVNKMNLALDLAFYRGSGSNQPLGAVHASNTARIEVAEVSGQTNATVVEQNLIDMYDAQKNKANAVWMLSPTKVLPQIMQINRSISTAGGVPLFVPPTGLAGAPYGTIFGRPVIFCDACPALGTSGDIAFVDWGSYYVAQKAGAGINAETSIHVRFDYDQMCFRFIMRVDGKPGLKVPYTLANGDTVSPFVVLQERK